jgi:hypothetical protein
MDDDELSDEMEHSEEEEDIVDTDDDEEEEEEIYEGLPYVTTGVGTQLGEAFTTLPPININSQTVTVPITTPLTPLPPITVLSPAVSPITTLTPPPITQFIQPAGAPQLAPAQLVTPNVVCLKGKKGTWGVSLENAPPDVVYIGRAFNMGGWKLPASKWNNPYQAKKYGRDEAVINYRAYILNTPHLLNALPELSGKTLACWCAPDPCHGDVLVQLFNERLLGKTTAPVPVLPTATQIVASTIPAAPSTNITFGLGGLPPLPAVTLTKPVLTSTAAPFVPAGVPKLVISPTTTGLIPPLPPVTLGGTTTTTTTTTTAPALPPPIPAELIRPMPVLAVQKPSPALTIQPTSPTAVTTTITGGILPPLPPAKIVVTQPVAVQPVVKPVVSLDGLLVKSDTESNDLFNMRSAYSRAAMKVFNNQINPATAVLIGRMAANKAIFGVTYPDESDRVLRYVNAQIAANPTLFTTEIN